MNARRGPVWGAVRHAAYQHAEKGKFILTGSATPNHKAERIAKLKIRPMLLYESDDFSGKVLLEKLCHGELLPVVTGKVELKKLSELIIWGGWLGSIGLPLEQAAFLPTEYLNAVINDDAYRVDKTKRDTTKMRLFLTDNCPLCCRRSVFRAGKAVGEAALLRPLTGLRAAEDDSRQLDDGFGYLEFLFDPSADEI